MSRKKLTTDDLVPVCGSKAEAFAEEVRAALTDWLERIATIPPQNPPQTKSEP
jgi:hypothetical protein